MLKNADSRKLEQTTPVKWLPQLNPKISLTKKGKKEYAQFRFNDYTR